MAGASPPDPPLVPVVSLGALDGPAGARPDAAVAFTAHEPRLFALAWLITGGHDGAAAHALAQTRDRFVTSWTGVTDATAYARLLLVPRACRAARGVHPPATGIDLLDRLLTVQPRARAALVLHEALGLDDAATGQLLEVDQYEAASLERHALGACRFTGVPEVVRATFDEQVARVVTNGLPAATPPRTRRKPLLIGAVSVAAVLAGLLAWRTMRDGETFTPADPTVTHYVALDAATGWRRDSVDVTTVDYGLRPRVYIRTGRDGVAIARLIVLPFDTRTAGLSGDTQEQIGDHTITIGGSADDRTAWVTAPCGNGALASFGVERDALVAAAATMRCDPDGSRRVVPPSGLREHLFPDVDRTLATTANYRKDDGYLFVRAEPALIEPEIVSGRGAHIVRRDGTRYVVSRSDVLSRIPQFTVRWRLGDALVGLDIFADLDEAAVIDLAANVHAVDEVTFRADPPTTTR